MVKHGRPSCSSWKECVQSSSGRTIWGKAIWESSCGTRFGKFFYWECLFVNRARGLFLSVYVDDIKWADKTENIEQIWKIFMEDVDLGEPTSFLDHVYLGCTQRECKIRSEIVANYRNIFESRISAGAKEKPPIRFAGKLDAEIIFSWSDMEGHAKKCVERYCEVTNKTTQHLYKVAAPCMDDHQFEEEGESVGELPTVCSQIVLKCLYLARIRETWYFMVCEQTCSYGHTVDESLWQSLGAFDLVHSSHKWIPTMLLWETQHNNANLECFKTLILHETLKTQNQHQEGSCVFSEVTRLCQ